jgi:hypothetical protein
LIHRSSEKNRAMRLPALLLLVVLSVCLPVAEAAASGGDVIADCTKHGTLTKHYSQREYRQALASLPADVDEYGDCRNVIKDAQVAGAASTGSRKGSGAAAAPASFNQPPSGPTASGPSTVTSGSGHNRGSSGGTTGHNRGSSRGTTTSGGDDPTAVDPGDSKADNPTNTDENAALIDATHNGGGAVKVGKDAIAPGAQNTSFTESLPAPVLGVLALLGVAALAAGVLALRRKLASSADS